MKIFITADHHFNHKNIIKYCNRPYRSVKQMNGDMIKKWNKKISVNDVVYHLGDFALVKDIYQLRNFRYQLNGTIFILPGNHDRIGMLKNSGFVVITSPTFKIKNLILSHRPLERVPNDLVNVHGHIHEKETYGRRINASVDVTNFEPKNLNYYVRKAEKILKFY